MAKTKLQRPKRMPSRHVVRNGHDAKFDRLLAAFANAVDPNQAVYSDRGRVNPMLGNRANAATAKLFPPTSGMTGLDRNQDVDYFRQQAMPPGRYQPEPDPSITPGRVTLSVRMRWNPIKGLTFDRLVSAIEQFHLGYYRIPGMLWEAMERRDYQIKVDAGKRKKAIAKNGYEIMTVANVPESDKQLAEDQKEFMEDFYGRLTCTSAVNPDEEGSTSLLFRQMMDAHLKYYAVHDIVWQPTSDGRLTAKLINVPMWWVEGTRGRLRFLQSEFSIYGIDMAPGEWLITCGDGLMEALGIVYLFKNLPLKNWLQLLDRLGQGGLIGKTNAQFGSAEWQNFFDAVRDFSQDWSGVFSAGTELTLLEAKNVTGDGPFNALIDRMDRAITSLLRGSAVATRTSGPDEQGSSIQMEESHIYEADDAALITETLKQKLSRYALAWKFGDKPQYAYLEVKTTPRQDVANDLLIDKFLSQFGLLEKTSTLERYSRPLPDQDAEILKTSAPAPAPGNDDDDDDEEDDDPPANGQFTNQLKDQFTEEAEKQFAASLHDDLAHAAQTLMAALQISDDAKREARLKEILADWPGITADALMAPKSAGILANAIATAYAHGLQEKPKEN